MAGISTGVSILTATGNAIDRSGSLVFTNLNSSYSTSESGATAFVQVEFELDGTISILNENGVISNDGTVRWFSVVPSLLYPYFEIRFTLQSGTMLIGESGWNPVAGISGNSYVQQTRSTVGTSTGTVLIETREVANPGNYLSTTLTLTATRT